MSQTITRALMGDVYEYRLFTDTFTDSEVSKYKQSIRTRYSKLTNNWNKAQNTEWVLRHYLATKMILASTVMFTSLDYAINKNLRIVEPYLIYYALMNSCRALVFTLPEVTWNEGEIISMTHSKIGKITHDCIRTLNKKIGEETKEKLSRAKDYREIFSYRFPANGLSSFNRENVFDIDEAVQLATLICEVAQFNSEQLQASIDKYNPMTELALDRSFYDKGFIYGTDTVSFRDSEDWYRLDYIFRKQKRPYNLYWTMTQGMVEDFFGAWCADEEEEDDDIYNPDNNWRIIFQVP